MTSTDEVVVDARRPSARAVRFQQNSGIGSVGSISALAVLLSACASAHPADSLSAEAERALGDGAPYSAMGPRLLSAPPEFFEAEPDLRRCAAPLCGGYFVRAVNRASTRCGDGSSAPRCYVASIQWGGAGKPPSDSAYLIRGHLETALFPEHGSLGTLVATDSWGALTSAAASGAHFRVEDSGLRCITSPCFSMHAELLNVGLALPLSDLDLTGASATDEQQSAATAVLRRGELFVAGRLQSLSPQPNARVRSQPLGLGLALVASQLYAGSNPVCQSHADCPAGSWCRARAGGPSLCAPFAVEGEPCTGGGSTAAWEREGCSPELYCDVPDPVADGPGVCRPRCDVCAP